MITQKCTLKTMAVITLILSTPFLLINLTDGSVPSPLESSSGCCSIVDVSKTGATDDIGDPPDIEADPSPPPSLPPLPPPPSPDLWIEIDW